MLEDKAKVVQQGAYTRKGLGSRPHNLIQRRGRHVHASHHGVQEIMSCNLYTMNSEGARVTFDGV